MKLTSVLLFLIFIVYTPLMSTDSHDTYLENIKKKIRHYNCWKAKDKRTLELSGE